MPFGGDAGSLRSSPPMAHRSVTAETPSRQRLVGFRLDQALATAAIRARVNSASDPTMRAAPSRS